MNKLCFNYNLIIIELAYYQMNTTETFTSAFFNYYYYYSNG